MSFHGVEEDGYLRKGTQKDLYEAIKKSDKVLCF